MSRRQRRTRATRHRRNTAIGLLGAGGGAALVATMLSGTAAEAGTTPTITVTGLGDTASPSASNVHQHKAPTLADAIAYIDSKSGGTITFASGLSGTIGLTSPLPLVLVPTDIKGLGPRNLTVKDESASTAPVFHLAAGDTYSEISGMTISGGTQGGIYAVSPLEVTNAVITNNGNSGGGGGIFIDSAPLLVKNTRITDNTAMTHGGGIEFVGSETLRVEDSTISGNAADFAGGIGAYGSGTSVIYGSTISGNSALNFGGIDFNDTSATSGPNAFVVDSTIAENTASGITGGIYIGDGNDGGHATLTVLGSTIARNVAQGHEAGGMEVYHATAHLDDTILAANTDTPSGMNTSPDLFIYSGSGTPATVDARFSVIGDGVDTELGKLTKNSTDIVGSGTKLVKPNLGPLQGNGGPTETLVPKKGSPAIGKGNAELFAKTVHGFPFDADQRGHLRAGIGGSSTHGDRTDIGAVEVTQALQTKSFVLGNQRFSLRTASNTQPLKPGTTRLPVAYTAAKRGNQKPKLQFKHVVVDISGLLSTHRYKPAHDSVELSLKGLTKGHHRLDATVTYTERSHGRTETRVKSLTFTIDIS